MVYIVAPSQSDVDQVIRIAIHNLSPRQQVAVVAQVTRNSGSLTSFANYESNDNGVIDLTRDAALLGGTYQGCEPMGLFWSMELTSEEKLPFKMLSGNKLDKWTYEIRVLNGHYQSMDDVLKSSDNPLAQMNIDRIFLPFGVTRYNIYYGKTRGVLFLPEGNGQFPALIDISGEPHGLVAYRGGLFAKNGFACLCVAIADYADLPDKVKTIDSEYFDLAYEFLSKHPAIDKNNIGLFGSCLGGTIALMLARCQPGIKAVAVVSPEAFTTTYNYRMKPKENKTKKTEVKLVKGFHWPFDQMEKRGGAYDLKPAIATVGDWHRFSLDYGRIKAPLLFFYGTDDRFCTTSLVLPLIKEQLEKENKTNAEFVVYPEAGHVIQPPFLPLFSKYFNSAFDVEIWYGGKTTPHARAQESMWLRTVDFFKQHLSTENKLSKL